MPRDEWKRVNDRKNAARKWRKYGSNLSEIIRPLDSSASCQESAEEMIPCYTEMLEHENVYVRCHAAVSLGDIGPRARTAVPALVKLLSGRKREERLAAALALGEIGRDAKVAIPALVGLFKDRVSEVRRAARDAFTKIGGKRGTVS